MSAGRDPVLADDRSVLRRAREIEGPYAGHELGPEWTWDQVRASPRQLVRLVVEGHIKVVGRRYRARTYRLTYDPNRSEQP